MRLLVVGSAGMLGQDMLTRALEAGCEARGLVRADLDVRDADACHSALAGADVVVNCVAWTAVDAAQESEAAAFDVNATGAANLARAATRHGARLVQISTDYVFDGTATSPYPEDAVIAPVSAYGRTKAAGEWAVRAGGSDHHIVRTAWLYGACGPNFPRTIARVAAERGAVSVVEDQHGQPTWTRDVADLVLRLVEADLPGGTFHATAQGSASWFDFARRVVATAGLDPDVVSATTSADFVRPAPRPAYSVLSHAALAAAGLAPIGPWADRWDEAGRAVLTV